MRTLTFRGLFALVVALLISTPAMAQNLVRGTVLDAKQKPVEGATVNFEATSTSFKRDVKTDKKGEFIFQGLQSGEYKITASKDGVGVTSRTYNVTANSGKEKLTFDLAPASGAGGGGGGVVSANPTVEALVSGAAKGASGKDEATAIQLLATEGMEADKGAKYDVAASKFNDLAGKVPGCLDCYTRLGNAYVELKKFDEAEAAFKKSVAVKPSVEAYTQLARIYNTQKKFDLAGEASKMAADLAGAGGAAGAAPNSETAYNQGVVLWNGGKYAEAKTQFEIAVKANPANAEAQYQLGMANLNLGQLPAARTAFEDYLKAAPTGPKAAEVKTFLSSLPK